MSELLRTESIVKTYRRRRVVNEVSIHVGHGEIVGLLGPNGAGKTTTFYSIVGLVRPDSGKVFFEERDVTRMPMHMRARIGTGYLSQEPSVFRKMTVEQNVMAVLETLPMKSSERVRRRDELLNDLGIAALGKQRAYTLSGGERRRLEIARALVTSPRVLLLDEPFSGVDPLAVLDVQNIIKKLRGRGLGVLLTDHNVRETLSIVDRAYLIWQGKVLREGTGEFLINDKMSRELYLGPQFAM